MLTLALMTALISEVKISETQDDILSSSPAWQPNCWQSENIVLTGIITMGKELQGEPEVVA